MNKDQNCDKKNLLQLIYLRLIAIFGQAIVILFVYQILHIELPLVSMFSVILLLAIITFISFYRYRSRSKISSLGLFIELIFDVVALTAQLYLSGGISNPFISLFLLQVIIGAVLLRPFHAWMIALVTIICYIWLSFNYQELHAFHHHAGDSLFNLHLHGMLISYIFATILLLIFITKIIENLNERDRKINVLEKQSIKKEQVVRMGLLATGAAHELSTPLSTISVIIGDWNIMNLDDDLKEDARLIESQIAHCKKILSQILLSSGKERVEEAKILPIKEAFEGLIKEWSNSRNTQILNYNFIGEEERKIILDDVLSQVFFNIFDNALAASPGFILAEISVNKNEVTVSVEDKGKGFSDKVLAEIGNINLSTKNSSGLGLFLAINSLNRIGGKLEISNLADKGAKVLIKIPLENYE